MKKVKTLTIAKYILMAVGMAGLLTVAIIAPNSIQMLKLFGIGKRQYKPRSIYQTLKRLERQKFIETREKNSKTFISITTNGKKRLLEYEFDNMTIKKPAKWDKKWRVIAFDIPESKRTARAALRKKLFDLGFKKLQRSVFIYPYSCKNEIDFVGEFFGVQQYISFIEADYISNDNYFRKEFGLV
jgi:DNA-binding transcriptional regulator PaaX